MLDPQQTDPPASGASPPAGAAPSPSGGGGVNRRHLIAVAAILLVAVGCAGLLRWVSGGDEAASTTPLPTYERPRWIVEAEKKRARQAEEERTRRAAVTSALEKQSAALLQGDRARFVAAIDPGAKRVAPWLTERFDSLRAMRVARWSPEVTGFTRSGIGGVTWRAKVTVNYCLVDPRCIPMTVDLHTMWELGPNTTRLTEVWADPLGEEPPPWSTSRLEAVVGERTVIATTAKNAHRLRAVLPAAEAAARVADGYAGTGKPARYVVYLAGDAEWGLWSSGELPGWVDGYAVARDNATVVQLSAVSGSGLEGLLRHELGHVATLADRPGGGRSERTRNAESWWLVEGVAEYVEMTGRPYSAYPGRRPTAAFVRGRWRGDLPVPAPGAKASDEEAAGRYGVAYLGVRCLADRYGRDKMLEFFRAVAVKGAKLRDAAQPALGAQWSKVTGACSAYVRRTA